MGESRIISENRRAHFNYFIEERFEAGLALQGWEVKAIRAGRANIGDAYAIVRDGELYLLGSHIQPLVSASTHVRTEPTRTRKLLLHREEIRRLIGKVEQRGFTLVPLDLHYHQGLVKCALALARGKQQHDRREDVKARDWQREQGRLLRQRSGGRR